MTISRAFGSGVKTQVPPQYMTLLSVYRLFRFLGECLRLSFTIYVYLSLNPHSLSQIPMLCGTSLLVTSLIYKDITYLCKYMSLHLV